MKHNRKHKNYLVGGNLRSPQPNRSIRVMEHSRNTRLVMVDPDDDGPVGNENGEDEDNQGTVIRIGNEGSVEADITPKVSQAKGIVLHEVGQEGTIMHEAGQVERTVMDRVRHDDRPMVDENIS
ncbi:hypothetical protein TorRG33x02_355730 [Trema orientale]|uniref:Uncharacterized protein n=1 Tax=Trema orientale TaxID=63057 RepID=A0A2P5A8T4_TREOI|nr:hypothetical protein TorRG33x02_355730 [Trema orientale]